MLMPAGLGIPPGPRGTKAGTSVADTEQGLGLGRVAWVAPGLCEPWPGAVGQRWACAGVVRSVPLSSMDSEPGTVVFGRSGVFSDVSSAGEPHSQPCCEGGPAG